ncbi:unannotated protein [freshwater metagenome]|uniref:Unannotated protein n=1 Tax=freshwater metagenome TaxID=449393 RepID=A0A6J6GNE5_9ZZZZ
MSRPCCFAVKISVSASEAASWRRRALSSSASSRKRVASSVASRTKRVAVSSERILIFVAASRAAWTMRAVSSPSRAATVSSFSSTGAPDPTRWAFSNSPSRKMVRSVRRESSAATIRRKSRTSFWSKPRREEGKVAPATAVGEEGSGRENEIAIAQRIRKIRG